MAIAVALTILISGYAVFAEATAGSDGTAAAKTEGSAAASEAAAGTGSAEGMPGPGNTRPGINENDLIYFVLTDRFYDGDTSNNEGADKNDPSGYHGGDFQGIIDKLDYIKDLGFTTIWISPVVKNQIRGYHGYWAIDFYKTNEHFGDMAKLKELVNTAHSKGIKVMFDFVVNHTGVMHPWVSEPKYADWFHKKENILDYNNQQEVEQGWLSGLPDLNQENPEVEKYLIDMAKWWIEETGIDGYRLDTVKHVSKDFWKDFSQAIKKDYPDFYLMGEVWSGGIGYVAGYQNTGLDGLVDFPMYYRISETFKDFRPATALADAINSSGAYADRSLMATFIDNHDVPRYVDQLYKFKDEKLKQALTFMMTYTGIPLMYYGTEIGMEGGADPSNRQDMDWAAKSGITGFVKQLAAIRKSNKALTEGDIKVLSADRSFISYSRTYGDNTVIVCFNTGLKEADVSVSLPKEFSGKTGGFRDLIANGRKCAIAGDNMTMKMAPLDMNILVYDSSLTFNEQAGGQNGDDAGVVNTGSMGNADAAEAADAAGAGSGPAITCYVIGGSVIIVLTAVLTVIFLSNRKKKK